MTTIEITLPDRLVEDAQRAGLLTSARIETLLRRELETAQPDDQLGRAMDRMAAVTDPSTLTPEEVAAELRAMRAERRARGA
jgi:hypothetical protein